MVGTPTTSVSADIAAVKTDTGTLVTRVPSEVAQRSHLTNGTGNITPPTNIGIWDRLDTTIASRLASVSAPANFSSLAITAGGLVDVNDRTGFRLSATGVDDIHDEVFEGTVTWRQLNKLMLSVLAGKSTGGGTATLNFRNYADTINRVAATVDANGNRTAITLNVT